MKTSRQWLLAAATVLALGLVELRIAVSPAGPPGLGYSGADMGPDGPGYRDVTMHGPRADAAAPREREEDLPDGLREILEARKEDAIDGKDPRRFLPRVTPPVEDIQAYLLPPVPVSADRDTPALGSAPSWGWLADGVLEAKRGTDDARSAFDETAIFRPPAERTVDGPDDRRASLPDRLLPAVGAPRDAAPGEDPFTALRNLPGGRPGEEGYDALPGTMRPGVSIDGTDTRSGLRDRSADAESLLLDTRRETFTDTLKIQDGTSSDQDEPYGRSRRRLRDEDGLGTLER